MPHGLDHVVEADFRLARVAVQRELRGCDGFHRAHGIAFDAGDLHQAFDRVAGESEVVFHRDLGGHHHLLRIAAQPFGQCTGRHGG